MSDPVAPRTQAGRQLLANLEPRFANLPWDPVSYEMTRQEVLAIEAEARLPAPLDVERLRRAINEDKGPVFPLREFADRVIDRYARLSGVDTPPAAAVNVVGARP